MPGVLTPSQPPLTVPQVTQLLPVTPKFSSLCASLCASICASLCPQKTRAVTESTAWFSQFPSPVPALVGRKGQLVQTGSGCYHSPPSTEDATSVSTGGSTEYRRCQSEYSLSPGLVSTEDVSLSPVCSEYSLSPGCSEYSLSPGCSEYRRCQSQPRL